MFSIDFHTHGVTCVLGDTSSWIMAQMSIEGSGRHELYELLRHSGMAHLATTMVRLEIASVNDVILRQDDLLGAGVHQWQLGSF